MPETISGLDFLADEPAPAGVPPVVAVLGDDAFLKRGARQRIEQAVLGSDDADMSLSVFAGDAVELRDVIDELSTVALFGNGRRLVWIEAADDFVSRHRAALEDYVARPASGGVLVLDVGTWPANTRLAKAVAATGMAIDCRAPAPNLVLKWLMAWARQRHGAKLDRETAETLLEMIGPELGLLDQELAKLASSATDGKITPQLVDELVTGGRAKTTWDMLDAAVAGDARTALAQLDLLLRAGESPIALLAQMGSSLRRFATATRSIEAAEAARQRINLRSALESAGFKPFLLTKAEAQLKKLGRERGGQLLRWLLEADLALKGASSASGRTVLEQLVARLSDAADPRKASGK
ncbi:MAG TPA: DNA polymerase III subunit delta [Pirellulales bacterium]|jgi:DNA polymerase-3 subunit delta|nr:DNA polymerase III subunit delta [Pirellulales bacterium]